MVIQESGALTGALVLSLTKNLILKANRDVGHYGRPPVLYRYGCVHTRMPIRGEQNESARRVEIRRRCHVEIPGLRDKMYEKRRNKRRFNWKTHISRYLKVQDRCYRSYAENESNAEKEGK
jgi:hypothetical protein